jgi:hypothetical protein
MDGNQNCKGCSERDRCEQIYEAMGRLEGPSVTVKVIFAFLVPILLFIAVSFAAERFTVKWLESRKLQILLSAVAGGAAVSVYAFAMGLFYRGRGDFGPKELIKAEKDTQSGD